MLNSKADELLLKICSHYITTGHTEFPSADITLDMSYDQYYSDLVVNDYIIKKNDVNETIVLLDRAIMFAQKINSI